MRNAIRMPQKSHNCRLLGAQMTLNSCHIDFIKSYLEARVGLTTTSQVADVNATAQSSDCFHLYSTVA